jgi:hypothetical protein
MSMQPKQGKSLRPLSDTASARLSNESGASAPSATSRSKNSMRLPVLTVRKEGAEENNGASFEGGTRDTVADESIEILHDIDSLFNHFSLQNEVLLSIVNFRTGRDWLIWSQAEVSYIQNDKADAIDCFVRYDKELTRSITTLKESYSRGNDASSSAEIALLKLDSLYASLRFIYNTYIGNIDAVVIDQIIHIRHLGVEERISWIENYIKLLSCLVLFPSRM